MPNEEEMQRHHEIQGEGDCGCGGGQHREHSREDCRGEHGYGGHHHQEGMGETHRQEGCCGGHGSEVRHQEGGVYGQHHHGGMPHPTGGCPWHNMGMGRWGMGMGMMGRPDIAPWRFFVSREEKITRLEAYLKQIQAEEKAVQETIENIRKRGESTQS